jgi:polar amino acid transport system substrate-binding protein
MTRLRPLAAATLSLAALALAACGSSSGGSSSSSGAATGASSTSAQAGACTKDSLALKTGGQLTVATDKPAYPPYFVDDKPANGKGFESAVAYAIGKQLGFAPSEVKWVTEPFNSSYAPGPKKFDFDVNQISITDKRKRAVDFSSPYYTAPQAFVVPKGSKLADAKSLADFKDATIGVQIGTTSLDAVQSTLSPSKQPKVFNDSNDVVTALKQNQVDAVVIDLPSAFYLTAAQVPGAKIAGQFAAPGGDQWGALLQKGSKLTACVSEAIDQLRNSGKLEQITKRWMGAAAGAPKLQ